MKLNEIIPRRSSFELRATSVVHYLRPLTLSDEIWLSDTFGEQELDLSKDMNALSRIIFHQLEDMSFFKKQEVEVTQEDGTVISETMGGYKLFQGLVSGSDEKEAILQAWLDCTGMSRPEQEEVLKKKVRMS